MAEFEVNPCLEDPGCLERLGRALASSNASNASLGQDAFDLAERPIFSEFEEPDSRLDLGAPAERGDTIFVTTYTAVRGSVVGADSETGKPKYGQWDIPILMRAAMLAFMNGLVITPPAQRAPNKYHFILADTCKEPSHLEEGFRCTSPYALSLAQPLLLGRRDPDDERFTIPPAGAALGGSKFSVGVGLLASAIGLPNMGFKQSETQLSNKKEYPTYVRTKQTFVATFSAMTAVATHLGFTKASIIVCDVRDPLVKYGPLVDQFVMAGVDARFTMFEAAEYSVWPPGTIGDIRTNGEEGSNAKKEFWDNNIKSLKSFNAHLFIEALERECAAFDVVHYMASQGLVGGGYAWMGWPLNYVTYTTAWLFGATVLSESWYNSTSPYVNDLAFDGYIGIGSSLDTMSHEYVEFWDIMAFIGQNQDRFLPTWLQGRIPAAEFTPTARDWARPDSENIVDATFAVLLAINAALVHDGPSFTNAQLLERMRSLDFVGIGGRILFDRNGDRVPFMSVDQIAFDPSMEVMISSSVPEIRQVGTYVTNLTITSQWSFFGGSPTAPPDKDLPCEPGRMYVRQSGTCRDCPAGKFTRFAGRAECEDCIPGSFNNQERSSFCIPCAVGYAVEAPGSTECQGCEPGKFNDSPQQSTCRECGEGTYSSSNASRCELCDRGKYAVGRGNVNCTTCAASLTTRDKGSLSSKVCLCGEGTYRAAGRDLCVACPEGMACAMGSDEATIPDVIAGECPVADAERCAIPQAKPHYMTLPREPLRAFKCLSAAACPGGPPGSCAKFTDNTQVACAVCEEGAYKDGDACYECSGGMDYVVLVLFVLFGFTGCAVVIVMVNRDFILQSNAMLTVTVIGGITITSIQTLGVFHNLALEWFEPLKSIFKAMTWLSFNLEGLKLSCFFKPNAETMYLFRQLVAPSVAVSILFFILLKKKFVKPDMVVSTEYINSAGTIFSALFISMTTSAVLPLICYAHPDGSESMLGDASILCFEAPEHKVTILIGAASFVFCLLPFIAVIMYGTAKHGAFLAEATTGRSQGLQAFRFLYFRFQATAHFYGALLMVRSLLICLVPVVIRNDMAFQVCLLGSVILFANVLQLQLQPWRNKMANCMDGLMTSGMVLFLLCGTASSDFGAEEDSLSLLGSIVFAGFLFCITGALGFCIHRRLRPSPWFQWFVCHHKRDGAAQARMLKVVLTQRGQSCFIDSDDLMDLDKLFDIVKTSLEHLVILLTREVLTRPWCAGEIATSTTKGIKITCIEVPGFVAPDESNLKDLANYLDLTSTTLSQYSISFEAVAAAYRRLQTSSVPKITVPEGVIGRARFHYIAAQLLRKTQTDVKQEANPGGLVVSSDPADDEATAAAGILISKIQQATFAFMPEGVFMLADEAALDSGQSDVAGLVDSARAVIVVLSIGSLACQSQLQAIVAGMARVREAAEAQLQQEQSAQTVGGETGAATPVAGTSGGAGAFLRGQTALGWKSESAARAGPAYEVIPVNTPSFQFPAPDFFDTKLPSVWEGGSDDCVAVKTFFKRLCISFQTNASDTVLQSQADQVVARIPRRIAGARSSTPANSPRSPANSPRSPRAAAAPPAAPPAAEKGPAAEEGGVEVVAEEEVHDEEEEESDYSDGVCEV